MDKEVVVHINTHRMLLSYKKEHISVNCNEVDETGAYWFFFNFYYFLLVGG